MIIGLSGYARTGKNEVAEILTKVYGYPQRAYADKLRQFLYALDPMVGRGGDASDNPIIRLRDVIDSHGWENYKETENGLEVRLLLQRLGTEAGRGVLGENIWVHAATYDLDNLSRVVFTDCRFPNEADRILDLGGIVVRINRPGIGPLNDHASENSLDDHHFDALIDNDGDLIQLEEKVRELAERFNL